MKITRKNKVVTTTIREVKDGQVFEYSNELYMKVYDADTEIYCPNCDELIDLNNFNTFLAVNLADGGLYDFSPAEEVIIKECEVIIE